MIKISRKHNFFFFHFLTLIFGIPVSFSGFYSTGDPIFFNFMEFLSTSFGMLGFIWWVGMIVEKSENKFLTFCRYYGLLFSGAGLLLTIASNFFDISFRIIPLPSFFEYKSKIYSEFVYGFVFLLLLLNARPKTAKPEKNKNKINVSLGWITTVIGVLNILYFFILLFKYDISTMKLEFFFYLFFGIISICLGLLVTKRKYFAYVILIIGYAVIAMLLLLFYQASESFLGQKYSILVCLLLPLVEFITNKLKEGNGQGV